MPPALVERLRARGLVLPDYTGGGLVNVAATMLDVLGARDADDPPPLRGLDPGLAAGVRQVVIVLADGSASITPLRMLLSRLYFID